jgi:hypothetical protein
MNSSVRNRTNTSSCRIAEVVVNGPGLEATTHLYVVLTSGMSGAFPTFLYVTVTLFVYLLNLMELNVMKIFPGPLI